MKFNKKINNFFRKKKENKNKEMAKKKEYSTNELFENSIKILKLLNEKIDEIYLIQINYKNNKEKEFLLTLKNLIKIYNKLLENFLKINVSLLQLNWKDNFDKNELELIKNTLINFRLNILNNGNVFIIHINSKETKIFSENEKEKIKERINQSLKILTEIFNKKSKLEMQFGKIF